MSIQAVWWAAASAPVANPEEFALLTIMAQAADPDGCNAFRTQAWYANRGRMSDRTVRRRLADLEERGVIKRGDQSLVSHLPADERPIVWDLQIPFDWFKDIDEINDYRFGRARVPLTKENRPNLAPAPARRQRADAGVKKRPDDEADLPTESAVLGSATNGDQFGGTTRPPGLQVRSTNDPKPDGEGPDYKSGRTSSPGGTGLEVQGDRTSSPTKNTVLEPVLNTVHKERTTSSSAQDQQIGSASLNATVVQPRLDGTEPDPPAAEPDHRTVAFGIARSWIEYRKTEGVPIVMRGRTDPVHAVRNLVEPALRTGYTENEIKSALARCRNGIPSASQLDGMLSDVRQNRMVRQPNRAGTGAMAGANLHVDDLTPEERRARNPFFGAARSSEVGTGDVVPSRVVA